MAKKLIPEIRRLAENITSAAFKFVEERLLLNDSPVMEWSLKTLEKTYDITSGHRKFLECKRLKLILFAAHNLKPGTLVQTRREVVTRVEVSVQDFTDRKWKTIPPGEYVMYLDVVFDENYSVPTVQLLWNERVLYMHHDSNLGADFANIEKFLKVFRTK